MEFRHVEDILQHCGQGLALSVHANGDTADTGGLNGTVVPEDNVHGVDEGGVIMEPVAVCAHIARGAGIDDPTSLKTLRTGIDFGLQYAFTSGGGVFGRAGDRDSVEESNDICVTGRAVGRGITGYSDLRRSTGRRSGVRVPRSGTGGSIRILGCLLLRLLLLQFAAFRLLVALLFAMQALQVGVGLG